MIRVCSIVLSTIFLNACGGGGSSGDSNASQSMVPTPSSPGAVLYANAADLRPLRAGAQWRYHGTVSTSGGIGTYYTASLTQKAGSGQEVIESSSDVLLSGNDSIGVAISSGNVVQQVTDPFGLGNNEVVGMIELRSPVRINDQYTLIERNDVPLRGDIDGDGKEDVADVALYSVVKGTENVSLPELGRTVSAVRVDVTGAVRAKYSSNGSLQPIQRVVESSWYAAGIGVIRRTRTAISTAGVGPVERDETLFSWDGITEGLGAVGPMPAKLPQQPDPLLLLPTVHAAAVVGDSAIALADSSNPGDPPATNVAIFDKRGTLQAVYARPGLVASPLTIEPKIFGVDASTALVLTWPQSGVGGVDGRWQRLGIDGSLSGAPVTVSLGALDVAGAWDGEVIWLAWNRPVSVAGGELVLRPFGLDGQPLAPAQVLDSQSLLQIGRLRMAATAGQVLITWARFDQGVATLKYATLSGGASSLAVTHTLGTNPSPTPIYDTESAIMPLVDRNVSALVWTGPIISYTGGGPLPERQPRGVTLDATGDPLRSTAGSLDDELLPSAWSEIGQPFIGAARGAQLVFSSFALSRQISQLSAPSDVVLTTAVTPGTSALAAAATSATSFAGPSGKFTNVDEFGRPVQLLLWDDRALVFGNNNGRTMVSLFWLR